MRRVPRVGKKIVTIEAFAAEARAREAEGDQAGRDEICEENRPFLQLLHDKYIAGLDQTARRPNDLTHSAWCYLYPPRDDVLREGGPAARIIEDRDFQQVIRRGSHDETYEFVRAHAEEIYALLERRLDVSFSDDTLMMPIGKVFNPRGTSRGQLDSNFIEARGFLTREGPDYARAATLFERLAERLDGKAKDVATDFLAYALAGC